MLFLKKHKSDPDREKLDNNRIWWIIKILTFAGAGMLALVSFHGDLRYYLATLGTALLMGGACFCMGALAGFLFGIPRIMESRSSHEPLKSAKGEVLHNDNLVQISDWLTKIIVGVGLTQINKIPEYLDKLGEYLGPSFMARGLTVVDNSSKTIAICVVLYFLIMGFIACYLWTRFYFAEMLKDSLETDEEKKVNVNIVEGNVEGNVNINEGRVE